MKDIIDKITKIYKEMMYTYFIQRKANKILIYLHEDVKCIGSGEKEITLNKKDFYNRLCNKLSLDPTPYEIEFKHIQINQIDEVNYLLYSEFILTQRMERKKLSKKLRQSIVYQYVKNKYLVIAMHTSPSEITNEYETNEFAKEYNEKVIKGHEQEKDVNNSLPAANPSGKDKEQILSYLSHEIRTPLNGIKGTLDLLMSQPEYKYNRYIINASKSANQLMKLVNDILDLSKIESGKMELTPTLIFIVDLIEDVDAIIQPLAEEKGLRLSYNYFKAQYNTIMIDESKIKQVLINLLSNSIHYTKPGGKIKFDIITNKLRTNVLSVFFIIEDTGIGMSEEFLKNAFEPFTQENNSNFGVGTGLGLSITKSLVELMKGNIRIESKINEGTKIVLQFTLDAAEQIKSVCKLNDGVTLKEDLDFTGKRALIVEDNELNMEIAAINLQMLGMSIDKAMDGDKAVEIFRKSKEHFYDIIFMDITMPKKDGLQASKEIRDLNREDAKLIPIIAMSANVFIEDVNKALENGMNYHLSKPFDQLRIQKLLKKIFYPKD